MDNYSIIIYAPIEPTKQLQKQYEKLSAEIGELAQKRRTAQNEWNVVAQRVRANNDDPLTFAEGRIRLLEIEQEQLSQEIPVWKKVDAYLLDAINSRNQAIAVSDEIIAVAREKVWAVFLRDFEGLPYRQAAVEHYVNLHPVVLGAMDRKSELETHREEEARGTNARTINDAENRLRSIPVHMERFKEQLAIAQNAKRLAEEEAKLREDVDREKQAALNAARERAAAEARRRLKANEVNSI